MSPRSENCFRLCKLGGDLPPAVGISYSTRRRNTTALVCRVHLATLIVQRREHAPRPKNKKSSCCNNCATLHGAFCTRYTEKNKCNTINYSFFPRGIAWRSESHRLSAIPQGQFEGVVGGLTVRLFPLLEVLANVPGVLHLTRDSVVPEIDHWSCSWIGWVSNSRRRKKSQRKTTKKRPGKARRNRRMRMHPCEG